MASAPSVRSITLLTWPQHECSRIVPYDDKVSRMWMTSKTDRTRLVLGGLLCVAAVSTSSASAREPRCRGNPGVTGRCYWIRGEFLLSADSLFIVDRDDNGRWVIIRNARVIEATGRSTTPGPTTWTCSTTGRWMPSASLARRCVAISRSVRSQSRDWPIRPTPASRPPLT